MEYLLPGFLLLCLIAVSIMCYKVTWERNEAEQRIANLKAVVASDASIHRIDMEDIEMYKKLYLKMQEDYILYYGLYKRAQTNVDFLLEERNLLKAKCDDKTTGFVK